LGLQSVVLNDTQLALTLALVVETQSVQVAMQSDDPGRQLGVAV